ncbi:MAG TPA: hypothetical protein VGD59_14810 [Acidisarcina sp.]
MKRFYLLAVAALSLCSTCIPLHAQDGFVARWQARATATQNGQPHWVTPLVTVTPRLEQEFRSDFVRQIAPAGTDTWNYGNNKGLELIPVSRVELIFNVPAYIQHNTKAKDGFADTTFLLKYRILGRNEKSGDAIVTAFIGGSYPTGSYKNGSVAATVTPTLAAGKGFSRLDIVSTLGAALPVTNATAVGRPITWNTTLQQNLAKYFWPEVEFNNTFYHGGPSDGHTQSFVTPGLMLGRFHVSKEHRRLGITFGLGEQIALTHFHNYNHALVFSGRVFF